MALPLRATRSVHRHVLAALASPVQNGAHGDSRAGEAGSRVTAIILITECNTSALRA